MPARSQRRLARFTGSACAVAAIVALGAPPAAAAPDLSILTLNLWHWVESARDAVGTLLDEIDDLPAVGAGGPTFLVLQEVSLPLVDDALAAKGYFLVAESAASSGIGKVVASKTAPYHARFTNRFGEACTGVCDIVETCTIAGGDPICVLDVHSQAWQVDPPCEVPPAVSCPLPGSNDAYREELSRTVVARTRELARGGFLVLVAGDFNAPVDATSISILEEAGLVDAWKALGLPECTPQAPGACTLVDNPIEGNIVPGDVPDHRRIDHLFAYGAAREDGWLSAAVRFDGGAGGPRVSGQNGVLGVHGGPGAFDGVTPEGEYDVNLTCTSGCSGLYPHRMRITTWNPATGAFAGTGFYVPDPSIHWIVEGTTSGSSYELTYTYVGSNAGFVGTASGTLDPTGAPTTGAGGSTANALTYTWAAARRPLDLRARYAVDMTLCGPSGCPGTVNQHTMDVSAWNPATGAFAGRGRWNGDPSVTWSVAGDVTGTRFDLVFTYDGTNAGYQGTVVGSIDPDGRLHFGLGSDNASSVNRFAFEATAVPEPASALGAAVALLAGVVVARVRLRRRVVGLARGAGREVLQ